MTKRHELTRITQKLLWAKWPDVPEEPPMWLTRYPAEVIVGESEAWARELLQHDLPLLPPVRMHPDGADEGIATIHRKILRWMQLEAVAAITVVMEVDRDDPNHDPDATAGLLTTIEDATRIPRAWEGWNGGSRKSSGDDLPSNLCARKMI